MEKVQKIPNKFGGGAIITSYQTGDNGMIENYSYTYHNPTITDLGWVLSYEVDSDNNVTLFHYLHSPEGMSEGQLNDEYVREKFASDVTPYLNKNLKELAMENNDQDLNTVWDEFKKTSDFIIHNRKKFRQNNIIEQDDLSRIKDIVTRLTKSK
jgi:intein/homing endonuclease